MSASFFTPPYVGVFLEGYLTNLDWHSLIVNAVQAILSILVWYPFFKIYEKRFMEKENTDDKAKLSAEDEEILKGMDLDI